MTSIREPGERDVPVETVFTPAMFAKLKAKMIPLGWVGIDETEERYNKEFKQVRQLAR